MWGRLALPSCKGTWREAPWDDPHQPPEGRKGSLAVEKAIVVEAWTLGSLLCPGKELDGGERGADGCLSVLKCLVLSSVSKWLSVGPNPSYLS